MSANQKIQADGVAPTALPARFAALPTLFPHLAWIEDSSGRILATNGESSAIGNFWPIPEHSLHNLRRTFVHGKMSPLIHSLLLTNHCGHSHTFSAAIWPLPPAATTIDTLRLIALFPSFQAEAHQHRLVSTLLACILREALPDNDRRLTPQQQAIHNKLTLGFSYKEIAACLDITHATVRVQIVRMRKKLGDLHIPLLRQCRGKQS